MRALLCGALLLCGCYDWESLSTRFGTEPDLAVSPIEDLATPALDDLAEPPDRADMVVPPDMSPPPPTWPREYAPTAAVGPLNSIFGGVSGGNLHLMAVGDVGQALRYNTANKTWSAVTVGNVTENFKDVWLQADNLGWIVGNMGGVNPVAYRWNGTAWAADGAGLNMGQQTVWGNAGNNVLSAGSSTTSSFQYTTVWAAKMNAAGRAASALWGAGNRFWLVATNNDAMYVEGAMFTKVDTCGSGGSTFYGAWGFGAEDAWTVGDGGYVCRWNTGNKSWDRQNQFSGGPTLRGIWGTSASNIWVVGDGGLVARYDGKAWTRGNPTQLAGRNLNAIWGRDATNFWVVTNQGEIFRAF